MPDETQRTPVDAVRKFLEGSGYPLEMQVARAFQRGGFQVEQARQYLDPATDELRDLDVLAITRFPSWQGLTELWLVNECKRSATPWMLFIGDEKFQTSEPHFHSLDIVKYEGGELAAARAASDMPTISYVGPLAYAVRNAGAKDTITFDAIRQVNSAVMGVQRDFVTPEQYEDATPVVVVLVPVVVTDAPLVEVRLNFKGELDYKPLDKGSLVTRLRAEQRVHSVWIVNEKAVPTFAAEARKTGENMRLQV